MRWRILHYIALDTGQSTATQGIVLHCFASTHTVQLSAFSFTGGSFVGASVVVAARWMYHLHGQHHCIFHPKQLLEERSLAWSPPPASNLFCGAERHQIDPTICYD